MDFSKKTSDQIINMIDRGHFKARVVTTDKRGKESSTVWKPAILNTPGDLPANPHFVVLTRWDIEDSNWADEEDGLSLHINNNLRFELRKVD